MLSWQLSSRYLQQFCGHLDIFGVCGYCLILLIFFYTSLYVASNKYIQYAIRTDLRDIEKSYMSDEGCHMWGAELCGKVVGMVGLRRVENMSQEYLNCSECMLVPRYQRMGIGKQMLTDVITHARNKK